MSEVKTQLVDRCIEEVRNLDTQSLLELGCTFNIPDTDYDTLETNCIESIKTLDQVGVADLGELLFGKNDDQVKRLRELNNFLLDNQ